MFIQLHKLCKFWWWGDL